MNEYWKDVIGYEGLYKVSNTGRVWSVLRNNRGRTFGGRCIKISIDNRNRCTVELSKNGINKRYILARIVASAFIRIPTSYEEINHIDENTLNNNVSNLEWCSHKYNCNYGTRIERIKDAQNMAVLQYTLDGKFIAEYGSMHIAANAINADAGHICDCCSGNRSRAYGYFWRYKNDSQYISAKEKLRRKSLLSKKSRADKFTDKALNVVQLELDGTYIRTFKSSRLAAESVNSYRPMIINCCNGKCKQVKGYKWMYERDYQKLFINTEEERKAGTQLTFF